METRGFTTERNNYDFIEIDSILNSDSKEVYFYIIQVGSLKEKISTQRQFTNL